MESYTINLRTLTEKSKLGFGNDAYKDVPIRMLMDIGRNKSLIAAYYQLSKITFVDKILDELCILKEDRIDKPSKLSFEDSKPLIIKACKALNNKLSQTELMSKYSRMKSERKKIDKSKAVFRSKYFSKSSLANRNKNS
jgi:hypothetical protein